MLDFDTDSQQFKLVVLDGKWLLNGEEISKNETTNVQEQDLI